MLSALCYGICGAQECPVRIELLPMTILPIKHLLLDLPVCVCHFNTVFETMFL